MFAALMVFVLIGALGVGAVIYLEIQDIRYHKEIRDELRRKRKK